MAYDRRDKDNGPKITSLGDLVTGFSDKVGELESDKIWDHTPVNVVQFIEDYSFMDSKWYPKTGEGCRPCVMDDLVSIFGTDPYVVAPLVREAFFSEGIGTGKSTKIDWILSYLAYKLLALHDPIKYLQSKGAKVDKGTKIGLAVLSRTEQNAKDVAFGKINSSINRSRWFNEHYMPTPDVSSRIELDAMPKNRNRIDPTKIYKNINIIPGSSSEYSIIGYDVIGVVIDEVTKFQSAQDRGLVDEDTDQAEVLYNNASSRIQSRYGNNGLVVCCGNPEHKDDFLERHSAKKRGDDDVYIVSRRSIWNSVHPEFDPLLKDETGEFVYPRFYFDTSKRRIVPDAFAKRDGVLCVPDMEDYRKKFTQLPEAALRDYAGIPTESVGSYLANPGMLGENENPDRDDPMYKTRTPESPFSSVKPFFIRKHLKWHSLHLDLAETGDAASFCLSHPVSLDEDLSPTICIDLIYRYQGTVQRPFYIPMIYSWIEWMTKDKRIPLGRITADTHQSAQLLMTLKARGYSTGVFSVDKNSRKAYDLLIQKISERKLDYYRHEVFYREFKGLERKGDKVVKPRRGSDDVVQAVAGSVWGSAELSLLGEPDSGIWDTSTEFKAVGGSEAKIL